MLGEDPIFLRVLLIYFLGRRSLNYFKVFILIFLAIISSKKCGGFYTPLLLYCVSCIVINSVPVGQTRAAYRSLEASQDFCGRKITLEDEWDFLISFWTFY